MPYHENVPWPADGVLMVMPFDPDLHGTGAVARKGRCQWRDADHAAATWSVVQKGSRWAVCDADLVAFARAELSGSDDRQAPPNS